MPLPRGDKRASTIVVIGAGIIGLSSALTLQSRLHDKAGRRDRRYEVLIVAREWPEGFTGDISSASPDYASMLAGAHVRPIPADTPQLRQEAKWLKATVQEFERQVQAEPWIGISRTLGREYLEAPSPAYKRQDSKSFGDETGLSGYRSLGPPELPQGVKLGFEYQTYCINTPLYCTNLLRKFILRGGKTVRRGLSNELEAFSLRDHVVMVVNASGTGFGDSKCFPTRGQIMLTNIDNISATITRQNKDGTWSFIIPRSFDGGTIIGGTKEPHDWNTEPAVKTREVLLSAAAGLNLTGLPLNAAREGNPLDDFRVIRDVVGRRPTREGGMRLELEQREGHAGDGKRLGRHIVHAYGAGGRGYEMSWGVAADVAKLVLAHIDQVKPRL
ncbi:hypothetical protein Hte_011997 [Hypoxylon texense]